MKCPKCQTKALKTETRQRQSGKIYRRHHCPNCGFRFSTYEIYAKDYTAPVAQIRRR